MLYILISWFSLHSKATTVFKNLSICNQVKRATIYFKKRLPCSSEGGKEQLDGRQRTGLCGMSQQHLMGIREDQSRSHAGTGFTPTQGARKLPEDAGQNETNENRACLLLSPPSPHQGVCIYIYLQIYSGSM